MPKAIVRRRKLITVAALVYFQYLIIDESLVVALLLIHPPITLLYLVTAAVAALIGMIGVEGWYLLHGRLSPCHGWTYLFVSRYIFKNEHARKEGLFEECG
jgi:hypothetical protein